MFTHLSDFGTPCNILLITETMISLTVSKCGCRVYLAKPEFCNRRLKILYFLLLTLKKIIKTPFENGSKKKIYGGERGSVVDELIILKGLI